MGRFAQAAGAAAELFLLIRNPRNYSEDSFPMKSDFPASPLPRRWFLRDCGVGLAGIALNSLLARDGLAGLDGVKPQGPHFPGKAKRVIYLFQAGAPSQIEL